MRTYPIGQRVRVKRATSLEYLIGQIGTVIGPPERCARPGKFLGIIPYTKRWIGQRVSIDGIGDYVHDYNLGYMVHYHPRPSYLEPLDCADPGSWLEIQRAVNWSPAKERIKSEQ